MRPATRLIMAILDNPQPFLDRIQDFLPPDLRVCPSHEPAFSIPFLVPLSVPLDQSFQQVHQHVPPTKAVAMQIKFVVVEALDRFARDCCAAWRSLYKLHNKNIRCAYIPLPSIHDAFHPSPSIHIHLYPLSVVLQLLSGS